MEQIKEQNLPFEKGHSIFTLSEAILMIESLVNHASSTELVLGDFNKFNWELIESHRQWYKKAYDLLLLLKGGLNLVERTKARSAYEYSALLYHTSILLDVLGYQDAHESYMPRIDSRTFVNFCNDPFKLEAVRSIQVSYPFLYKILRLDDLITLATPSIVISQGRAA